MKYEEGQEEKKTQAGVNKNENPGRNFPH